MRILYSHYLPNDDHPAARMVTSIGEGLRSLGHELQIHRCAGPAEKAYHQSATKRTEPSVLRGLRSTLWFAKAMARNHAMYRNDFVSLEQYQPDIVLSRQDAYCWSMVSACRKLGVPVVTYADAPVAYETRHFHRTRWHPPFLLERIEKWGLGHSRAIITISHPAAELLQDYRLSVPIHVIPNGIAPTRFPSLSRDKRREVRSEFGVPSDAQVVGFLGTFRPFHGIDLLRELIDATRQRPKVHWVLIGDGPERGKLEAATRANEKVHFLGHQPGYRVGELLTSLDVGIVPHQQTSHRYYFCPLKLLEYAAAGCPVVARSVGDIPKLLDQGKAGVLVETDDSETWSVRLNELLDDPQQQTRMGAHAREFILRNYTWDRTAEQVSAVLQTAL